MWREKAIKYFKAIFQHSPEGIEQNYKTLVMVTGLWLEKLTQSS
jgi:effector-binding domain-containing protein